MSQSFAFYDARAIEAAAAAEAATLDNVRDRNLRAEKTWRALADQAFKVQEDREKAKKDREDRLDREERERMREELCAADAASWADSSSQS